MKTTFFCGTTPYTSPEVNIYFFEGATHIAATSSSSIETQNDNYIIDSVVDL